MFVLKKPIKSRRDGQDVAISEIDSPEKLTVGMYRRFNMNNEFSIAHSATTVCAGLSVMDGSAITTADALQYFSDVVAPLLEGEGDAFAFPKLKPIKALFGIKSKMADSPVEFCCQALLVSGMDQVVLNALDIRTLFTALPEMMREAIDPN